MVYTQNPGVWACVIKRQVANAKLNKISMLAATKIYFIIRPPIAIGYPQALPCFSTCKMCHMLPYTYSIGSAPVGYSSANSSIGTVYL